VVNDVTYAFLGLERAGGGVLVYDLSDPASPAFVEYVRSDLDISPEGLLFIPSEASPNGMPLLVVTNEISGTVAIYQIESTD
jgi:2',3'-cyclic-nucleotide 2'-phosphodiesterase/3'-nucleotidase/5'-nucleotidase